MPRHRLLTAAALTLVLGVGAVQAQQVVAPAGPAALREVEDDDLIVPPFNTSVERMEEMDVIGANGEEIGEIDEVLMDATGRVVAVVVEVGGFLGIGEREVVIQLDQLQLQNDRFVTILTKAQLEALSPWEGD